MLRWLLTGGAIPGLLILMGVFFLFYLRGIPLRSPALMLRAMKRSGEGDGVSPFRAVMLALAGTLGVGNMVGVANAIMIGGAGAILWMWISALLAMILKYAEILLSVAHRRVHKNGGFFGGAYYYIKDLFEGRGAPRAALLLSSLFALLMIVNSLSMGCVIQVNAVSAVFRGVLQIPLWVCGVLIALLTLPVVIRGTRQISALTEVLVPIMSAGYVILSLAVLILRHDALGDAFTSIFCSAFTPESAGGGIIGFLTSRALRVGTMRGLLSNEAGCGTAPTAHAAANTKSPAAQGVWGIFEVFVDTILLCTATALVILVSGIPLEGDAIMVTVHAYSSVLGGWAEWFFCAAILAFGYATLLCWAGYGLEALRFLCRSRLAQILFFSAFGACILIGAVSAHERIWDVADFAIAAMTSMNLAVLWLMRREIRNESRRLL